MIVGGGDSLVFPSAVPFYSAGTSTGAPGAAVPAAPLAAPAAPASPSYGSPAALGASTLGGGGATLGTYPVSPDYAMADPLVNSVQAALNPSLAMAGTATAPATAPASAGTAAAPALAAVPIAAPGPAGLLAPQRLTAVAPGGNQADADLVERALGALRSSPTGAQIVDRMSAVGARINVLSDEEFTAMGYGTAHAIYDPATDTMSLRRSDLADANEIGFAALALAHEGTHLLDDAAGVTDGWTAQATQRIAAAGGPSTAQGQAVQAQIEFELMMINETRAFTVSGQVARDLGVTLAPTDPTSVAAAGTNSQQTYAEVWNALLGSGSYNDQGRTAAVQFV